MTTPATDIALPFVHDLSPARLRAHQAETAARLGLEIVFRDVLKDGTPGPDMVVIPPGAFDMGAAEKERGFGDQPLHPVNVGSPFAMGRFCITAEEFKRYSQATGFLWADHLIRTEGRQPVTNIDRNQVQAYLDWLSTESGQHYRLPSEAEWEYAARAGSATPYCFGKELSCSEANTGSFRLEGRGSQGACRTFPVSAPGTILAQGKAR